MIAQEASAMESLLIFLTRLSFVLAIHYITLCPFSCFVEPDDGGCA